MNGGYEAEATPHNPSASFASHAKFSFGKKKALRQVMSDD
jgi:hypothetical protein